MTQVMLDVDKALDRPRLAPDARPQRLRGADDFKNLVLDLAYGTKGVKRIQSDGMLAATVNRNGLPVFIMRGTFGRDQFRRAAVEAQKAGIELNKMYVFADLATYSGPSIEFKRLDSVIPNNGDTKTRDLFEPTRSQTSSRRP